MTDAHEILILYLENELSEQERQEVEERLRTDPALAAELDELQQSLDLIGESLPDEPDAQYWRSFYSRIQPQLHKTSLWSKIIDLFRNNAGVQFAGLATSLAMIFVVVSLFLAQTYFHTEPIPAVTETTVTIKRTQGVLEHIVSTHLERSRLLLQEMVNVDVEEEQEDLVQLINGTRERGEQLLSDNRTYRIAAEKQNDQELVQLLDDLELVLVEISNLDPDAAEYAVPTVKRIIRTKNLLIKIEIINLNEEDSQSTDVDSREREVI